MSHGLNFQKQNGNMDLKEPQADADEVVATLESTNQIHDQAIYSKVIDVFKKMVLIPSSIIGLEECSWLI